MPASPATWLDDFVANTNPNGSQRDPVVTQLASGHLLFVWTDTDSSAPAGSPNGNDVVGRVFDPLGNAVTDEIRLNTRNSTNDEFNPSVTALANGGFVIAYDEIGSYDDLNIETYSFNPATAAVTRISEAYLFNDLNTAAGRNPTNPVIASASSTSVMAVYHTININGSDNVVIRTYNPSTNVLGAEIETFIGQTGTGQDVSGPDITALSNGNYAVTYVKQNNAPAPDSLVVDVRNQSGGLIASSTVDNFTDIIDPQIVALNNGNFVVAYNSTDENGNVAYRVFSNSGVALTGGGPFNSGNGPNSQNEPAIVALADGTFIIARDDDTTGQIIGERYSVTGQTVGILSGFVIDDTGGTSITDIEMEALADGRFVVTWDDGTDIRVKILDTRDLVNATAVYTPEPNWQVGTNGDDVFTTDDDADIVHGWSGNDTITGNGISEENLYFGDSGSDTLKVTTTIDGDKWDGGVGETDTIDLSLSVETELVINLTAATIGKGASSEVATNFENANGSDQNDTITGTVGSNVLNGLNGNDKLNGAAGADTLSGGLGNDTYYVDNAGDTVVEGAGEGTMDWVASGISYALGAGLEVEKLSTTVSSATTAINLTGNQFAQTIVGNAGANKLNGMGGADTMQGLGGNDTYYVDNTGDKVVEGAGQGTTDWVATGISYMLGIGVQVEILSTTASGGTTAINLTGNEFAQTITGNAGANKLDGKAGGDKMAGLGGNDTYYVDNARDKVVEAVGQGTSDWVATSVSYALGAGVQVERITTTISTATTAMNLTGNEFIQTIIGNAGASIISGKGGNDTLTGGAGNDSFLFDTAIGPANVDKITDYNVAADTIRLENGIFDAILGTGTLTSAQFWSSTTGQAHDLNDRIIYETDTGKLFYDTNGSTAGGSFLFATIAAGLALTNADFTVV